MFYSQQHYNGFLQRIEMNENAKIRFYSFALILLSYISIIYYNISFLSSFCLNFLMPVSFIRKCKYFRLNITRESTFDLYIIYGVVCKHREIEVWICIICYTLKLYVFNTKTEWIIYFSFKNIYKICKVTQ